MKFKNKIVFVTGAGQGIGKSMIDYFAAEGAKVVAADVNLENAQSSVEALDSNGLALSCNVADSESVKESFALVEKHFGQVDILINSAGVGSDDTFVETPDENWQRVIGVNLTGTFFCCREAARLMQKLEINGVLINISSTAVMTGEGPSHYVASKAGVMGLTRSMARELAGSNIRVNNIVPGPTNTPMLSGIPDEWVDAMISAIPLGRMGEPAEIAKVAGFIASDDASFVTGQNITVNGGMAFL